MAVVQSVLFDLDDTLIDRQAAFRRIAERFCDQFLTARRASSRADVIGQLVGWDNGGDADRAWLYSEAIKSWPEVDLPASQLVDWETETLAAVIEKDEGILTFLRELTQAHVPWGIVTNGGTRQRIKLKATHLDVITPFMIVSSEFGHAKPDLPIYLEALRRLGNISAAYTLFVGDNPVTDLEGARNLGMLTAWVSRGRSYPSGMPLPDYQIEHVPELRTLFRK